MGRRRAAGDLDGRDRAWGDALAAACAGREVDLGLRHAAKPEAEPDRTLRAGIAAALADNAAPGEAAVANPGTLAFALIKAASAAEQGASRERGGAASHPRHSPGAPGGPATSWYIQIRKP